MCKQCRPWSDIAFCARLNLGLQRLMGWLVVLGLTALWDSILVYIGPSTREREKEERKDRERKNVQTTPTRTYCKRNRPLPYNNPNK